jgi:branched-chain amino acid transport system ATP-binding protein
VIENPAPATTADLSAQNVTAAYDSLVAVRNVSVTVQPRTIVGVVGANGAGKTSLMRVLAGVLAPTEGQVFWKGQDVSRQAAHRRVRNGLALVQEGRHLFGSLSVKDNLMLGAYAIRDRAVVEENLERVLALFPALKELYDRNSVSLSGGEQQMVAIGRALMNSPSCLLIDEPSLGLAPIIVESLYDTLPSLCDLGLSVVIVEQEIDRILHASHHMYVMRDGMVVKEGPSRELDVDHITDAYLGA